MPKGLPRAAVSGAVKNGESHPMLHLLARLLKASAWPADMVSCCTGPAQKASNVARTPTKAR